MRTALQPVPFSLCLVLALGALAALVSACGDDDAEPTVDPSEEVSRGHVSGGPGDNASGDDECQAFCQKANECAEAAGRTVPDGAEDCAASCEPGGLHRQAPEALHGCSDEACGGGFEDCTRRAVLSHMRDQDIAIFPPICQGLCEKAAWCHRHGGRPLGPGEDDCEAACEPGGAFMGLPEAEMNCVHYPCGGPFTTCRAEGGASGPPQILPPPTPPRAPGPNSP